MSTCIRLFWWSLTGFVLCVVRAYISEYLKRIYFRKWCHGLYSGPRGIPDSLDGLREDAMFIGVPVTVCVSMCMRGWGMLVCAWVDDRVYGCVCVFDEVSDTSSRESSRVLRVFSLVLFFLTWSLCGCKKW